MLEWISSERAVLNGVPIRVAVGDVKDLRTTDEEVVVLKGRTFFEDYVRLCPAPKNILEVGVFEGGSALILASMYPNARIVGLDIRGQNPAVLQHIDRMGYGDRVSINYEVSQADEAAVLRVMDTLDDLPDLVIDDASHMYGLTRSTFEVIFPRLRPGALYVIEDWGWGHWPNAAFDGWKGETLSNLVFELVMASASNSALVKEVLVNGRYAAIRRGNAPARGTIDLDKTFLVGPRKWVRLASED